MLRIISLIIFIFAIHFYNSSIFELFESNTTLTNICSPLCCYSGWPNSVTIQDKYNNIIPSDINTKYTTSNYSCNNGFQTGCLCNKIN